MSMWPCPNCGGRIVGAVQINTYANRCMGCRTNFGCTSWMAVGPRCTKLMAFYREGDEAAGPVVVGVPTEIWEQVSVASGGDFLYMRLVDVEHESTAVSGA